jgi:hypothetical protein
MFCISPVYALNGLGDFIFFFFFFCAQTYSRSTLAHHQLTRTQFQVVVSPPGLPEELLKDRMRRAEKRRRKREKRRAEEQVIVYIP